MSNLSEEVQHIIDFLKDNEIETGHNKGVKPLEDMLEENIRLQNNNDRKDKIIDLLIDDLQQEGYLKFESKDDVLSYYNRRINLEVGNE